MPQLLSLLLAVLMFWPGVRPQNRADTPTDTVFYAVSYVEVLPSARTAAMNAMKAYLAANQKEGGFLRFELFEQSGRSGHFSFIEAWRDQAAFDGRAATIQKQLMDALQPIRISDLDRRPYKTLTLGAGSAGSGQTVYVITHVDVSPSPQVAALLQRMAEDSRRDEGNLRFDVLLHTMRANHFTVIEAWRDRKALETHAAATHTKQYREELAPFLGSPLDERLFEIVQ